MPKEIIKQRRRRSDKKYDEKYTKQLMSGIRYTQRMTVEHLCLKWKISRQTYYNWVERYPEFARAHEHGNTHYHAYLMDRLHDSLEGGKVNAASLQFALTNVMGWATKTNVNVGGDETIGAITINILEAPRHQAALQQLDDDDIIEGEILSPNVVALNVKPEKD